MATTVFFVSGTSLTIPSNYNSTSNTWEAIAGGGGGSYMAAGGGGEYRKITNASYTASASRTIQIGAGGTGATTNGANGTDGGITQLLADNNSTVALKAISGNGGTWAGITGVGGGSAGGGVGAGANFNGGSGGASNGGAGPGGGGAGGPTGAGKAGGAATTGAASGGGSGGGGSNGGGTGGATSGATGGAGGNGQGGTGGGVGGTASGVAGTAGTAGTGAGGGGGVGGGAFITSSGGNGATGSIWTQTSNSATAGPGGGGGGTGGDGSAAHGTRVSGNGGLYGGGGGGDGNFSTGTVKGGSGAQGIIVLTYTPTAGGSPYTLPATTGAVTLSGTTTGLVYAPAAGSPPLFRSVSGVSYASHANTVLTAPAGIQDGDILVIGFVIGGATTATPTFPAGFTVIDHGTVTSGGFTVDQWVAWKRASSESGSYTITHSTQATNAFIAAYSNCVASGSPIDAYSKNFDITGFSNPKALSVTTSVTNTLVLYIDHDWQGTGGRSPPTSMTERYEDLEYLADIPFTAAGATGDITATNNNTIGGGWQAWQVVLKPKVGTSGSPYTMPAATGTVTLAGTVTGLRAARQLAAVKGTIALAGTTTGLRAARTLTAVKGSIALAGLATGLRAARTMAAVKGSIVLTGFAAGLVYSSFKTLTAAVGSITLAGQAATFRLTRVVAAAKGTINLTGFDVVLTKTSAVVNKILIAAAGAFTFVGQDAALRRERRLPAATGAVTLAGQAAVLRVARKLAAAKGTITLAGSDTLLLKGKSPLLATTGAILVAGNTANLVYRASYRMPAISATVRVAAREAGLSRSGTEQPGTMEFGRKAYLRRW